MVIINKQISLGTDDCSEAGDASLDLTDQSTLCGNVYGTIYDTGLRWQSINIPQAASIVSATLSMYIFGDDGTLLANIRGIDEDNTATWSTGSRPSQRSKTTATIVADEGNWNNWSVGNWANINITSVVQEIIDRAGWSANNDLAIVIEDDGSASGHYTTFRSYEYAGNLHGAKLDIEYTEAGATIPIVLHLYNQMRQ